MHRYIYKIPDNTKSANILALYKQMILIKSLYFENVFAKFDLGSLEFPA